MGASGRGVQLDRAFRLVVAFQQRPMAGLTVEEIATELGCCRRTAYRYLEAAVLVLPLRRIPTHPVRYGLLRREDAA